MRDKLQALVDDIDKDLAECGDCCDANTMRGIRERLESILATEPPTVTVRAGWYAKDYGGIHWFECEPTWFGDWDYLDELQLEFGYEADIGGVITDPWPDHPNGGPECCVEVR